MKKTIALVALALGILAASEPAQADVGSCYSVQPICLGGQRVQCICDVARNCFWACR